MRQSQILTSIIVVLMMAGQVYAQSCTDLSSQTIDIDESAVAKDIYTEGTGESVSQEDDDPATPTTFSLTPSTITWVPGCYNTQTAGNYFGGAFTDFRDSFYSNDYDAFIDRAVYDNGVVYLYSDANSFKVINIIEGEVTAAYEYTGSASADVRSIAASPDGTKIAVSGHTGQTALLVLLDQDLAVTWSLKYAVLGWGDQFNSVKYDDMQDMFYVGGKGEQIEFRTSHILATIDPDDGSMSDLEIITTAQEEPSEYQKIQIVPGATTSYVFFTATDVNTADSVSDIIYGYFPVTAGLIGTADFLRFAGYESPIDSYYDIVDLALDGGSAYITFSATSGIDMYPGIMEVSLAAGTMAAAVAELSGYSPNRYTTFKPDGTAVFTAGNLIVALSGSFDLYDVTKVADTVGLGPITYADGVFYSMYYQYSDNYFSVAQISTAYAFVSAYYLDQPEDVTYDSKAIDFVQSDDASHLYLGSNNGGGFQNFGITIPIAGNVPEFSLATLLLATLLAGGLVLFVVRRRK